MKSKKSIIFVLVLVLIIMGTASAAALERQQSAVQASKAEVEGWTQWQSKTTTDVNKEWTIKFNYAVGENAIQKDNIYIEDSDGNRVETTIEVKGSDKKAVSLKPVTPYDKGKTYYIFVSKNIKSNGNKALAKGVKMQFTVEQGDDDPVQFEDPALEQVIRNKIGKASGPIYKDDLLEITKLSIQEAGSKGISSLEGIENLANIKELQLSGNEISDLSPLSGLAGLENLGLDYNNISDIRPLSGLHNLKTLLLSSNQIYDISGLGSLTNLETLQLTETKISNIDSLSGMTGMKQLSLEFNEIEDISALSNMAELDELYISNNNVKDISALSNLSSLGLLSAGNNRISDIQPLEGLTSIEMVFLSNNSISDINALKDLTNMLSLDISNNSISDIQALKNLTKLASLHLSGNGISDYSPVSGYYGNISDRDFELETGGGDPDADLTEEYEFTDGENDQLLPFTDITGGRLEFEGGNFEFQIDVRELPDTFGFDGPDVPNHIREYEWGVYIEDNSSLYSFAVAHYKFEDEYKEYPIEDSKHQFQANVWEHEGKYFTVIDDIDFDFDKANGRVRMSGMLPDGLDIEHVKSIKVNACYDDGETSSEDEVIVE